MTSKTMTLPSKLWNTFSWISENLVLLYHYDQIFIGQLGQGVDVMAFPLRVSLFQGLVEILWQ